MFERYVRFGEGLHNGVKTCTVCVMEDLYKGLDDMETCTLSESEDVYERRREMGSDVARPTYLYCTLLDFSVVFSLKCCRFCQKVSERGHAKGEVYLE